MHNTIETCSDATLLLGLEGLAVTRVERREDGHRVVHVITDDETARGCPACGVLATRVKECALTSPRDLCAGGEPITPLWHKRRWVCRERRCSRGSFTEQIGQVSAGMRTTGRLRRACGRAVVDGGRTVMQAARDHRLSWPVAMREVRAHAAQVLPDQPEPTTTIGIDEIRRGAPRWEVDPATGKYRLVADRWHVGFTDLSGDQGLLGQVEGRLSSVVAAWLSARSAEWKTAVTHVAIDMCQVFRSAIRTALPHAVIVVDHFHLVQLANAKLAELRRRLTWKMRGRRGRKGDPEFDHRRFLRSNAEDLAIEQRAVLERDLTRTGTYGRHILAGWHAKEKLRHLLALARTGPVRSQISHRLQAFYAWCADHAYLPELRTLAETITAWWPQIEAFIGTGITNAKSEGTNRVIKLEARCAYGFRNAVNQRLRSRCATTRASRNRAIPLKFEDPFCVPFGTLENGGREWSRSAERLTGWRSSGFVSLMESTVKITRTLRRLSVLAGLSAAMLGGVATAGHAAATSSVRVVQGAVVYIGTAGANNVNVFVSSGKINVTDSVAIAPGVGCQSVTAKQVSCNGILGGLSANLGAGNDTIRINAALVGGAAGEAGDDTFFGGTASGVSTITYIGGAGSDIVSFLNSTNAVDVNMDSSNNDGRFSDKDNVADDIEKVVGSRFDDLMFGDEKNNAFDGGLGRDTLRGYGGSDALVSRDGGSDTEIDCGEGGDSDNDTALVDRADPAAINCESVS
ncbi:hypothetical protein Acor_76610 [Acrocarpospora corrugata]|uniref:Transposase IS204/IS1001/IS1096/IS1165 DDE domain-containing protein n=1 Tax=Acrocarpospora corrugata TaxID=35763 RepID=A0A5M3WEP2_9ACTN|nr:ISL3 family transposase [Acrocarpospora corrugata]GES05593.1 hypothetical protein Acor_76610 [Acrocarpospora corrugata]